MKLLNIILGIISIVSVSGKEIISTDTNQSLQVSSGGKSKTVQRLRATTRRDQPPIHEVTSHGDAIHTTKFVEQEQMDGISTTRRLYGGRRRHDGRRNNGRRGGNRGRNNHVGRGRRGYGNRGYGRRNNGGRRGGYGRGRISNKRGYGRRNNRGGRGRQNGRGYHGQRGGSGRNRRGRNRGGYGRRNNQRGRGRGRRNDKYLYSRENRGHYGQRGGRGRNRRGRNRGGYRQGPTTRGRWEPSFGPKKNAAQKRQDQRDERRYQTNPNRSQAEEDAERWRKQQHAINRGPWADPYDTGYGNPNYAQDREDHRFNDHAPFGEGWNYIAWP